MDDNVVTVGLVLLRIEVGCCYDDSQLLKGQTTTPVLNLGYWGVNIFVKKSNH